MVVDTWRSMLMKMRAKEAGVAYIKIASRLVAKKKILVAAEARKGAQRFQASFAIV